ncbi:MAG: phosphodiester glycosidase family protein [Richelia sp.]|nr:phosphodiester glycosidase family protein [Richelia sp.]
MSPILATFLVLNHGNIVQSQESINLSEQSGNTLSGEQISLNGKTFTGAWLQKNGKTYLSDGVLMRIVGVDFFNSFNPQRQPIQWFTANNKPLSLASLLTGGSRYLDVTNFAKSGEWKIQVQENALAIITPRAKVVGINQSKTPLYETIAVNLNRPTPWQLRQELPVTKKTIANPSSTPNNIIIKPTTPPNREWTITLHGIAEPDIIKRYTPKLESSTLPNSFKQPISDLPPIPISTTNESLIKEVRVVNNLTLIKLSVLFGYAPRITTSGEPNQLKIEIRPDAMVSRSITWAKGIRWRQQWVKLDTDIFPVVSIELDPRSSNFKLRPFVAPSNSMEGTAPLITFAREKQALTAINGGFFNRKNRLPLGAIRRDNQWLSSPILNRGAIAWNDSGQFYYGRLALQEILITSNNKTLPILYPNSGFVQSGISRYTSAWGKTYKPIINNEIIVTVEKNKITSQTPGGNAGETAFPIPTNGYFLILRGSAVNNINLLPIGSRVRVRRNTTPAEFNSYPHILGAGPLLLQNRQIVLNGEREKFNPSFMRGKAIRSAICSTSSGNLMIAAVHHRARGVGPTLAEHAQLMQRMGCVNALNLDGGSSTSLYMGGQLLNRSPNTAARVHNGIGIFLSTPSNKD